MLTKEEIASASKKTLVDYIKCNKKVKAEIAGYSSMRTKDIKCLYISLYYFYMHEIYENEARAIRDPVSLYMQ